MLDYIFKVYKKRSVAKLLADIFMPKSIVAKKIIFVFILIKLIDYGEIYGCIMAFLKVEIDFCQGFAILNKSLNISSFQTILQNNSSKTILQKNLKNIQLLKDAVF